MTEDDDIDISAADALVARPPHCEHCDLTAADIIERRRAKDPKIKTDAAVLIEMQPGQDGIAWYLCVGCWVPGKVDRPTGERTAPTLPRAVKVDKPRAKKQQAQR